MSLDAFLASPLVQLNFVGLAGLDTLRTTRLTPRCWRSTKASRPVTTLHKPIEVSELRAVWARRNPLRLGSPRKPGTRSYRVGG